MSIILYDNNCNFCIASINFLKKNDKGNQLQFLALDSSESRTELKKVGVNFIQKNTVYFIHQNKAYIKSTAVLKALNLLPFPYKMLSWFLIVPKFLRDAVYSFIAKNRNKIISRKAR